MSVFSSVVQRLAKGFPDPEAAAFRLDSIEHTITRVYLEACAQGSAGGQRDSDRFVQWYIPIKVQRELTDVVRLCSECVLPTVPLVVLDEVLDRASRSMALYGALHGKIRNVYERVRSFREAEGRPFPVDAFAKVIEDELLVYPHAQNAKSHRYRSEGQRIGLRKTAS